MVLTAISAMAFLTSFGREANPVSGNYFWVSPVVTNGTGSVAGDVGPVGAMRYEDVVFLAEAVEERVNLSAGFDNEIRYLNRRLASTNVENVVSPFIDKSPFYRHQFSEMYIDTNDVIMTRQNSSTNVFLSLNPGSFTNAVYLTNIVTQTMKDGREDRFSEVRSFHTNLWEVKREYSVPVTYNNMEYLCISNGPSDMFRNPSFFTVMWKDAPFNLYSAEGLRRAFQMVRLMRRGFPVSHTAYSWMSGNPSFNRTTYRQWSTNSLAPPAIVSESTANYFGNYYWYRSFSETDHEEQGAKWDEDSHSWVLDQRVISSQISRSASSTEPDVGSFIITTRLPETMENDYGWCPIKKMNVFLLAEITYQLTTAISYTGTTAGGGEGTINENRSTNVVAHVAIPIQTVSRESGGYYRMIRFSATATDIKSSIERAMAANGIPTIDPMEFPPDLLRFKAGERIKLYPDHGLNTWQRTGSLTTQERISTSFKIGYVPEFKPRTVLGSWTEY